MFDATGQAIISFDATEIEKNAFCNNKTVKAVTVPSHIRRIGENAFRDCSNLKTVILQEGLEEIGHMAFWGCRKIETLVIPASVRKVEEKAFGVCESLKRVVILGENTQIANEVFPHCDWNMELILPRELRVDQRLHLFGSTFLYRPRVTLPQKDHSKDRRFKKLADRCASLDAQAMWDMADYLQALGTEPAYTYAANFWRYRAQKFGHSGAKQWLEEWVHNHPGVKMPALLNDFLSGTVNGEVLRFCGFLFFDADRSYSIVKPDESGVVEVSSWSSTEDADSDGFGMEECYDWWYLDEALQPLPGVTMVHDFSRNDKWVNEKRFQALHDRAAEIIRSR